MVSQHRLSTAVIVRTAAPSTGSAPPVSCETISTGPPLLPATAPELSSAGTTEYTAVLVVICDDPPPESSSSTVVRVVALAPNREISGTPARAIQINIASTATPAMARMSQRGFRRSPGPFRPPNSPTFTWVDDRDLPATDVGPPSDPYSSCYCCRRAFASRSRYSAYVRRNAFT